MIDARINGDLAVRLAVNPVEPAHGPAAKADFGHLNIGMGQLSIVHCVFLKKTAIGSINYKGYQGDRQVESVRGRADRG